MRLRSTKLRVLQLILLSGSVTMASGDASGQLVSEEAANSALVEFVEQENWDAASKLFHSDGVDVNLSQPDGMTALHWAVFHNHLELVTELISSGANPKAETEYGISPLVIACQNGHAPIAAVLLSHGADANSEVAGGETCLMMAARQGNPKVVQVLLDRGAEVDETERKGQTALMWAASAGNADAVGVLLKAGADIGKSLQSGFDALKFAAREGRIEVVAKLLEAGADVNAVMKPKSTSGRAPRDRMSPLMLAVESGHFELAIYLVSQGADPNDERSGFAPLHALSWVRRANRGDSVFGDPPPRGSGQLHSLQFVREIVAAGADVNMKLRKGSGGRAKLTMRGATPFLLAAKTVDLPLMKLLLELGADPTFTNVDGCTPLMAVAGIGVTAVGEEPGSEDEVLAAIDWLVSLGADPNVVDENKETAMHGAAYRQYPLVATKLSDIGADPKIWNHKNKYGWTPQLIAAGHRPGSFKPSQAMMDAVAAALEKGGLKDDTKKVERVSEYAK